jgi:hypothetical protein
MFEKASRLKLRIETPKGIVSVEDLWDMDFETLDEVWKSNRKTLEDAGESLLKKKTKDTTKHELVIDLVEHVVKTRQAEAKAIRKAAENKRKKENILGIIAEKENEVLKGASLKELKKMVKNL